MLNLFLLVISVTYIFFGELPASENFYDSWDAYPFTTMYWMSLFAGNMLALAYGD